MIIFIVYRSKLYKLCTVQPIQVFILEVDFVFYQNVVEVLLPDVLRPIPSALTQSIRNFAKGLFMAFFKLYFCSC